MIWTAFAMAAVTLSSVGCFLIAVKLWRDWDVRLSSVRWLFLLFFVYVWLYTTGRVVQYAWLLSLPSDDIIAVNESMTKTELDQLGIYMSIYLSAVKKTWVTALLCYCDAVHLGAAFWVLPLTYELAQIAAKNMDRGVEKEQRQMRLYTLAGHVLIAGFLVAQVVIAARNGGYSISAYRLVLAIYVMQMITLAYMAVVLLSLRWKGRNIEAVHGHFEASPVYRRLKRIMLVYALFAFQYEVSSLSLYWRTPTDPALFTFIAVSQIVYNSTGFALALITGCSLPCVLRFGSCCFPEDVEAQLLELSGGEEVLLQSAARSLTPIRSHSGSPPLANPVFVITDIESSSALWAIDDGLVMQRAVEMHDDIIRALLAKYRGYEITTAGDSFQLAFHTIREAIEYSLAVQMELLVAKWPKELHGLVPATKVERILPHKTLFSGLRVRIGIHDTSTTSEGPMIIGVHAVTGKTTYSGASFEIANEIGNLGAGGQILVSHRVAHWLEANDWVLETPTTMDRVGEYQVPHSVLSVELFQILPRRLNQRARFFSNRNILERGERASQRYSRVSYLEASLCSTIPTNSFSDGLSHVSC